ncbi:uncharacterized protein LOC113505153 [Trichoplusia ni]|uniref:Uncharacterized protein LOC113505153 n=1 Tax=Trichoplusia ni TaxID=7111 RepID=A0A7E5WTM0_TRINI|nr:uncharacterized protein LOC113505153 [Trichoplusia ni]
MGIVNSKDFISRRKVDEATSNSSLSNLRYVITEKPKWKVFKKKEVVPIPQYRPVKGCPCGNDGPCKQKVTPKGVTIHYPQKKRKFGSFVPDRRYKPPKVQKSYLSSPRTTVNKVKVVRPKKFPTWRLDKISINNSPFSRTSTSATAPGDNADPKMCDGVRVSTHVTTPTKGRPDTQGNNDIPSGLSISLRTKPKLQQNLAAT